MHREHKIVCHSWHIMCILRTGCQLWHQGCFLRCSCTNLIFKASTQLSLPFLCARNCPDPIKWRETVLNPVTAQIALRWWCHGVFGPKNENFSRGPCSEKVPMGVFNAPSVHINYPEQLSNCRFFLDSTISSTPYFGLSGVFKHVL